MKTTASALMLLQELALYYLLFCEHVAQHRLKYLEAEQKFAILTTLQKFLLSLSPAHERHLGFPRTKRKK